MRGKSIKFKGTGKVLPGSKARRANSDKKRFGKKVRRAAMLLPLLFPFGLGKPHPIPQQAQVSRIQQKQSEKPDFGSKEHQRYKDWFLREMKETKTFPVTATTSGTLAFKNSKIEKAVVKNSEELGIDANLLRATLMKESWVGQHSKNIGQLEEETALELAKAHKLKAKSIYDIENNITLTGLYLRKCLTNVARKQFRTRKDQKPVDFYALEESIRAGIVYAAYRKGPEGIPNNGIIQNIIGDHERPFVRIYTVFQQFNKGKKL